MIRRDQFHHQPFLVGIEYASDVMLREQYLPVFLAAGGASDIEGIRALCRATRERSLYWVVPCGIANRRGLCDCGRVFDDAAQAVAEVP